MAAGGVACWATASRTQSKTATNTISRPIRALARLSFSSLLSKGPRIVRCVRAVVDRIGRVDGIDGVQRRRRYDVVLDVCVERVQSCADLSQLLLQRIDAGSVVGRMPVD